MQSLQTIAILAIGVVVVTSMLLLAGEKMSKTVTITGEVIDTASYVRMDKTGGEHEMCAIACMDQQAQ